MSRASTAVVAGAGIFGLTTAVALRLRGWDVTVVDPGPVPHPLAESTDISKAVRMDYGADELYAAAMERALDGFRAWDRAWADEGLAPAFHETGLLYVTRSPMAPGGFEHDSFAVLTRRGHPLERLDAGEIGRRFPAWSTGAYVDGYFNPRGGFAESGVIVTRLHRQAVALGVTVRAGDAVVGLDERDAGVTAARLRSGERLVADLHVLAAGAWTRELATGLERAIRPVGQAVFHLAPREPERFEARVFPTFGADLARTGYYGFPLHEGVVKIAHHGPGRAMDPSSEVDRVVSADEERALRDFLPTTFPALADAPIVRTRVCVYGDSADEHFLLGRLPERPNVIVAAGGSGHGFKFAPLIGGWVLDVLDGRDSAELRRFDPARPRGAGEEAARHR